MSDPLHRAVDALIQPQRIRVYREHTHAGEWQTLPSLWDQLTSSGQWSGGNNGGGAFGSRPVISTGVVALIIEIREAITEAATDFGRIIRIRDHTKKCTCIIPRICDLTRRDYPAEIQAIAANMPDPDTAIWWTEHLRKWAGQAKAQLGLNPSRPAWARGTKCPDCGADTAQGEHDGETIRTPALAITWAYPDGEETDYHEDHDYKIRAVECRQCGMCWFRGPDLDALVDAMVNNQRAKSA